MLFKNPTLLYGLLFLVVPIIIHLFQLRRFARVAFSNVAFLKPLITETRKSNKLKKWLTLLARMLAITCIVLAFTQPFLPNNSIVKQETQTAIYLDNSYSMQAQGSNGPLYTSAINELIEKLPADKVFTLFTNDQVYLNTTKQQVANDLLSSGYSSNALSYEQVQLKAVSLLDGRNNARELIMISDFQKKGKAAFPDTLAGLKRELVQLVPETTNNISLDTAYVANRNGNDLRIAIELSSTTAQEQPVTVSLNNNNTLVAKTSVDLSTKKGTAQFEINTKQPLNGELVIEDNGLRFDNHIYISTGAANAVNVLSVSDADANFLNRIFSSPDFKHLAVRGNELNFNAIKDQNLIILNELKTITSNLASELNGFVKNGGYVTIIPHAAGTGYENLNGIEAIKNTASTEKKVTTINSNHPLLANVFSNSVDNFQYPTVSKSVYSTSGLSPVLKFDDGASFLDKKGNMYVFAAPINVDNSNFQSSPLIVPVFYNMGINSLPVAQLYYSLSKNNEIAVPTVIEDDQILSLSLNDVSIIPQQRGFNSYVLLQTDDSIATAGNYSITKGKETIGTLSFNSARSENETTYYTSSELGNGLSDTIDDLLYKLTTQDNTIALWKYFVLGALLFLLCELLILKYVK